MAKNLDPKCRLCRRAGEKLFLKGERCSSQKCPLIRKPYPPGIHGKARTRGASEYGIQLKEKQKLRRIYGIRERQLKNYFKQALTEKGVVGDNLLQILETRLDNTIFRLGFAPSRNFARQLVSHGHFLVNGRRITIPSFRVKVGDIISIRKGSEKIAPFRDLKKKLKKHGLPSWLFLDLSKLEGKIVSMPSSEDIGSQVDMALIIEYYSR